MSIVIHWEVVSSVHSCARQSSRWHLYEYVTVSLSHATHTRDHDVIHVHHAPNPQTREPGSPTKGSATSRARPTTTTSWSHPHRTPPPPRASSPNIQSQDRG
jgi:hypothetical protein